jgi:hypothetical protein
MAGSKSDDELAHTATAAGASSSSGSATPSKLGATLGRYRLERELGAGGMGTVHAAFDPDLERRVALKVLHDARSADDAARQRLLREARAMARLTHANVVTVHEVGSAGGRDYVAMELVDGETLADWLRATTRPPAEILDAFRAAGRGLAAAHAAGLVHRDFKPHNVLRRRDGRICVTDFGLARGVEAPASGLETTVDLGPDGSATSTPSSLSGLTQTGSVLGTPAYMAPEQWAGGTVGPAADQFAFSVALWEALTGERPFRGATAEDLRREVLRGPAHLDASKLPKLVRAALIRGLDPEPDERWPSMDALLTAITRAERRPRVALFALGGAVVASATLYVALGRGGAQPVLGCPAPARALDAVWTAADASALAAAGRTELRAVFDRDATAWKTAREKACVLPAERRGPELACLDGALARFDAVHHALERVTGEVPSDAVLAYLFDPQGCALATPPRLSIASTADTVGALALAIESLRDDTKVTVAQMAEFAAKPGLDACSRSYALHAELMTEKDVPKQRALATAAIDAAESCGDDRLRAESLIASAPFEYETPTIGPKGRAAIEKAKVAIDRVGQLDLTAKLDLARARVAAQDKRWDDAFAATDRAAAAYGARGRVRAQIGAAMATAGLRFRRNGPGDLEAVRVAIAKWRPIAVANHLKEPVDDIDETDAYVRMFLGDVAGAHPELVRLYKPEAHADVASQAIDGVVVDETGTPIPDATVGAGQLVWLDSVGPVPFGQPEETHYRMVTTDASGAFRIPDAATTGAVVAQKGDRVAAVKLAPHLRLVLAPTRAMSGKVKLGTMVGSSVFVMVMPIDHLQFGYLAPLAADGSFSLPAVPTTELYTGVSRWGSELSSDVEFSKIPAGRAPVTNLELVAHTSERTLVVVVRSAVDLPFDTAQVIVLPGRVDIKTLGELQKLPNHTSLQARFAKPIIGEAVPKDAAGKTRAGDLVAELTDVVGGDVTACVVGLHGDLKDPAVGRKIQEHRDELAVKCVVATPADRVIVVDAPPQKRFD